MVAAILRRIRRSKPADSGGGLPDSIYVTADGDPYVTADGDYYEFT